MNWLKYFIFSVFYNLWFFKKKYTNQFSIYKWYDILDYTYWIPSIKYPWAAKLSIGKYCSIAPNVTFMLWWNHRPDWVSTYPFNVLWDWFWHIKWNPSTNWDIRVGNDVWIAKGVTVMSGVTIWDWAVIALWAIVTKDIPPYAIAWGIPAKVIKYRFDPRHIEELQKIKWWDWSDKKVKENVELICSQDISNFVNKHKSNLKSIK